MVQDDTGFRGPKVSIYGNCMVSTLLKMSTSPGVSSRNQVARIRTVPRRWHDSLKTWFLQETMGFSYGGRIPNVSIWFHGSLRMVFTVLLKPPRLKKLVNRSKDGKEWYGRKIVSRSFYHPADVKQKYLLSQDVPIPSMYGIFTYIWLFLMVKYGKCR